ncbi:kinase-like domain-containing protein, partial [Mycena epipterygia]
SSPNLPDLTGLLVDEGRLRLLKVLGAGSYGVVYKALHTASSPTSPIYYAVKCLGFGTHYDTHGCLCVVLELAAGDLWAPIENGVFDNNNALIKEVYLQLVEAVRFCHQRGVHHRDLKPENILCSADGTHVRIADFGLAVGDELPCSTAAGTTCYMSPESLTLGRATRSYEADQSDVWALCIILLNLISGAFPWLKAVKSDAGWCSFLLSDTYLLRNCPISIELNDLLRKCFRPVPGARPSLDELRYEIANMKSLF